MLRIRGLVHHYPRQPQPALAGIDLDVPGEGVFGLLGPNGAGKTTLISILAGLLDADAGGIDIDGESLAAYRRRHPAAIALVPQEHAFYPMLTVTENLRFFAGVLGLGRTEARARVAAASAATQLEGVAGQRAETLSGGLRRRLNLAIGLLGAPRLLLLDEPTVGVDPQSRAFLLDTIRGLAGDGRTVIYTSHYMDEVEALCSRVAIIDHGRVLAADTLAGLLHDDAGRLALRLAQPLPAALAARLAAQHPALHTHGCEVLLPALEPAALPALLTELAAAGCPAQAVDYGRQNLETLFMRLTRRSLRD
ncbi:ABC transporter ATP-binding protein [Pseudothauera lacus]|uniref:ABC transporter ATP-binding protein n=1 Tax=Pseudothauera lacus TaxID=2136175 RepID=A0A2T4IER2_9RHOO|nr:ABC transporter ATP-binding protein [Pseudothauera lacus]PTD96248.1 ABC transporter ATP-binding protein [Pseudothauera lacus]